MIRFVPETGSTNADLLALSADAREGDWLVARRQSAGRGRAGRAWEDGAGNFMGSTVVALRPGDWAHGVVLAAATLVISPLGYLLTPWLGRLADNAAAALFFVA